MKDPLGTMGTETIFVMASFTGNNVVEEYENMQKFKAGVTRKTYTLPYQWDGTGGVVYGPYLYYNRYHFRINLGFWETSHLPLPKPNINPYISLWAKC